MISVIIRLARSFDEIKPVLLDNITRLHKQDISDVILVNDGMDEFNMAELKERHSTLRLLRNPEKKGPAYSYNRAAALAQKDILLFLDAELAIKEMDIPHIVTSMAEPGQFALSPFIIRSAPGKDPLTFAYLEAGWFYKESMPVLEIGASVQDMTPVLWSHSGAMVVSAARFFELGGFDMLYEPFENEDLDICYRAWKRGWKTSYISSLTLERKAPDEEENPEYTRDYIRQIELRNTYLFIWKNLSSPWFLLTHTLITLFRMLSFQISHTRAILKALLRVPKIRRTPRAVAGSHLSDRTLLAKFDDLCLENA